MMVCHVMDQGEKNEKVNQMDEVQYKLQGHNNLVVTNRVINDNKVINDTMMMVL
jgi:hypothetical protein